MLGSLQAMRVVLKNNVMMLRERGLFLNDRSYLYKKSEYLKAAKGEYDFKTITKEELLTLRAKIIKNRKAENLRAWIIATIVVMGLAFLVYTLGRNYSFQVTQEPLEDKEALYKQEHEKQLSDYHYYIGSGDEWIEKENWENAIYQYHKAVKIFPQTYEANYRLALAYSYNCAYWSKDCEIGKELTKKLMIFFPNEKNLDTLKNIFDVQINKQMPH